VKWEKFFLLFYIFSPLQLYTKATFFACVQILIRWNMKIVFSFGKFVNCYEREQIRNKNAKNDDYTMSVEMISS
jgi:hypothetical protein